LVAVLAAGLRAFSPAHQPLVADEALVSDGTRAAVAGFDIGPEGSYGYLIEADEDTVGLHPALLDGLLGPGAHVGPASTLQHHRAGHEEVRPAVHPGQA
jgi:hypothetical protein